MVKNTSTVSEAPATTNKKTVDNVNPRTTLVIFTGGIDSTYLLFLMKKKFEEVGANPKDLIPVWFEGASSEQLTAIKNISKEVGVEPLLLPGNAKYSPKDYLTELAEYCLDNKITKLFTALTNSEALSEIPDLDVSVTDNIETEVKDARKKKIVLSDNPDEKAVSEINEFHIEYPIIGLDKAVIIRRLSDVHKFDISKCYRNKNTEDVPVTLIDGKTKTTVNKMLDEIRKNGFKGTRFEDPLNPTKKAK
jgi:hypothetical protein